MTTEERLPRLSAELTEEQYRRLSTILDYGEQKKLFSIVVDTIIEAHDKHGKMAIYALMLGKVSLIDIMRKQEDTKHGTNREFEEVNTTYGRSGVSESDNRT